MRREPTVTVWARVTPRIHRQLDRVARAHGLTRAALIARLITEAITIYQTEHVRPA